MKHQFLALPFVLCLSFACGDDGGGGDGGGDNCTGTRLAEAKLCELTCGATTLAQAQAILGQPQVSNNSVLQYTYQCTEGTTVSLDIYQFAFPEAALVNVTRTTSGEFAGGTVPSCLSACD